MTTTTDSSTELHQAVEAFASALQAFDPYAVVRARTMAARVREALVAFKAATLAIDSTTPAQLARLEARILPLTKQARQKFATLASLTPAAPPP